MSRSGWFQRCIGGQVTDIGGWMDALRRCVELRPRVVVPAHGRLAGARVLTEQLDFIVDAWDLAIAAATGVRPVEELTSDDTTRRFLDRHPAHTVNSQRFCGMVNSLLTAARRKTKCTER